MMEPGSVQDILGNLNSAEVAKLRNHLLSQDVEGLGLNADQALGLLQALEERDARELQPNFPHGQAGSSLQTLHQPIDMSKLIGNINRIFGGPGGGSNSSMYHPVSELSAINERVQMLEMQRARILMSAQNPGQQDFHTAAGVGRDWTRPDLKRRMISKDEESFHGMQEFQGNWAAGGKQISQMNQSVIRPLMNQSGGVDHLNQSGGRGKVNRSIGGGKKTAKKQQRAPRKRKSKGANRGFNQQRGGQQQSTVSREGSYGRRSPEKEGYGNRRSRSRESRSRDRGQSYDRWSHDDQPYGNDAGNDQGYSPGRREHSRDRSRGSRGERYPEDDYRSDQEDNRSYQDEFRPNSPKSDEYFRSESKEFHPGDELDNRGDRKGRKRKRQDDFDKGIRSSEYRRDQEHTGRFSSDRDYPDEFFQDHREDRGSYQQAPLDFEDRRERSRDRVESRDDRRGNRDHNRREDIIDIRPEVRWDDRPIDRSDIRDKGSNHELFHREVDMLGPKQDMPTRRRDVVDLSMMTPRRRSTLFELGRTNPFPMPGNLIALPPRLNQSAQLPGAQFPRGAGVLPLPTRSALVSARMQGLLSTRNQRALEKQQAKKNLATTRMFENKVNITLANLLLSRPPEPAVKAGATTSTTVASPKVGSASPLSATPLSASSNPDEEKGKTLEASKSEDGPSVSGSQNNAVKTPTKSTMVMPNKPRPMALMPEANSINHQAHILEQLELQGFLHYKVMTLWMCYICCVSVKNGMTYRKHIMSAKHISKVGQLELPEGILERQRIAVALRNLPYHSIVSREQLSAGKVNRLYFCSGCGEGFSCTPVQHKKFERHETLEAYRQRCSLCNVYCSNKKSLVKHQNQKLHIAMKDIRRKEVLKSVGAMDPENLQNKASITPKTPTSSKASKPGVKVHISKTASISSKRPIPSKGPIPSKPQLPSKELVVRETDGAATDAIGSRGERKAIKLTLKGGKIPTSVSDSTKSLKKEAKDEDDEDIIGMDLVIPVTGFFCRCCSKFYNSKHMAKRTHCLTAEHKQKALVWYKSHDDTKSTPLRPARTVGPQTPPSQSAQDAIIVIDDDDEDEGGGIKDTPKKDKAGEETITGENQTGEGSVSDEAKDNHEQIVDKDGEGSSVVREKPEQMELCAVRAQCKSSNDIDLEDGEILSDKGELPSDEKTELPMEGIESGSTEQPGEDNGEPPTGNMETGTTIQTIEETAEPPTSKLDIKATDETVERNAEPSTRKTDQTLDENAVLLNTREIEIGATDLTLEGTVDPLIEHMEKAATDQPIEENAEPPTEEIEVGAADQTTEGTEEPLVGKMEIVTADQLVEEDAEPPTKEIEIGAEDQTAEGTEEPWTEKMEVAAADQLVGGDAELSSCQMERVPDLENLPSVGEVDPIGNERPQENKAAVEPPPAYKDSDLPEDDLYADLEDHAPEEENEEEEEMLEPREEPEQNEDEEMDDEDDTTFFIDEGNWEVRSEEGSSDSELIQGDGILESDEDDVLIIGSEEDITEDEEEKDVDTNS